VRVDESTIEIGGEPVFYRSSGEPDAGAAGALYLHGLPTSSDDWIPFLERTGGLAPDLRGFGRTGKGGHLDYTLAGYADFVERFLDDRDVPRVKLVGHDWGAAAGLAFAQRHPERIDRLVLINAIPLLPGFRWHRLARALRVPGIGELTMGTVNERLLGRTLRHGTVAPDAWTQQRTAALWQQFDQGTQRAILRVHRAASEDGLATAGKGLDALTAPALVIWGERDPWLPAELATAYGARLQNATVHREPDAGHWPWLDRPELIDRVAQFLK
jgi:pimeloyl-ACP methyl ester carboxylesterase